MRARALTLLVAILLAVTSASARAEFLLGLVAANELVGTNFEWAGEASSTYIVLGAYQAKTGFEIADMTGYIGHRRYAGGVFAKSTFFGGVVAGDLGGSPGITRAGIGGEAGYQWLTENLRVSIQAGLAILEADPASANSEPEPESFIGAGASIRF